MSHGKSVEARISPLKSKSDFLLPCEANDLCQVGRWISYDEASHTFSHNLSQPQFLDHEKLNSASEIKAESV